MLRISHNNTLIYWLSVGVAMALTIIPLPFASLNLMPDWVLLVLIYWSLGRPEDFNIDKAWCVGILIDVLSGQLLGQHALAYVMSLFLVLKQHKMIRQFSIIQQSLVLGLILFVAQVVLFWIVHINHDISLSAFLWPVLTGILCWPLVFITLNKVRTLL